MPKPNFSLSNPKRLLVLSIVAFFAFTSAIGISQLLSGGAHAMTDGSNSSNNFVQPYTGGAPVSKVFYPADGSTVTVTKAGAVIKQSPGHTPYREGWINPSRVNSLNSATDLNGQLASGSSNPYANSSSNNQPSNNSNQQSTGNNNQAASNNSQQKSPSSNTTTTTTPQTQNQMPASSSSSSSSANATADANVTLAANKPKTASKQPAATQNNSANNSNSSQDQSVSFSGKSLPNTGPGNVLAVSGVATVLGTIGHLVYQRLRYRSLAQTTFGNW